MSRQTRSAFRFPAPDTRQLPLLRMIDSFRNLRVTVMGLGSFGGGIGAVRFLVQSGARVTVTDLREAGELQESVAALADTPPAAWHLGGHQPADFEGADLVVASPAVPTDNPWLQRARSTGVPITSEIELFWERQRGRVVAVTGSNGKSTTTKLLHHLLTTVLSQGRQETTRTPSAAPPRVWLGGNIGHSLLPCVDEIAPRDWVVLELSSFQLENLARLAPTPEVSVVTNFTPNHLDRHHTLDAYRQAKQVICRFQTDRHWAIRNLDDREVATWPTGARTIGFGLVDHACEGLFARGPGTRPQVSPEVVWRFAGREEVVPLADWVPLPGRHNLANALAATAAALMCGGQWPGMETGLRGFVGLPHRLEPVGELRGVRYYNDSKATTPEAAALALQAFPQTPLLPLVGGYDKHIDLGPLVSALHHANLRGVVFLGQTGPELERRWQAGGARESLPSLQATTLAEAVAWCRRMSHPGDVVLLSPGCASHDWFRNYEERGELFRRLVLSRDDSDAASPAPVP